MDRASRNRGRQYPNTPNQVCRLFQAGSCRYGARCKFPHVTSNNPTHPYSGAGSQAGSHTSEPRPRNQPDQDGLREWKRLLNRPPDQRASRRFFQLAHKLMGGDLGAAQEVIKHFAQDDGLAFVRYLIERQIPEATGDEMRRDIWVTEVNPFFMFIVHPTVLGSAVFEAEVATIYNFTQGTGAKRMKTLFDFVMKIPDVKATISTPGDSSLSAIEICLQVLAKMIDCNTTNIINANFQSVFDGLKGLLDVGPNSSDECVRYRAQKYLQHIQRRLEVGDSLPEQMKQHQFGLPAEFVVRRDLPGRLSPDGPRHDNDHVQIADISIMPTYQEIISPRSEYLPTSDSSLFHLPGIRGRLDREFRLLREDTVGQLRDAVHAQLNIMKRRDGTQLRKNNGLRTYVYEDAAIEDISFNKIKGMDLLVRIRQAATVKELQKRRDWWTHSKRFQSGALVCLVCESGSLLFCVVGDETAVSSKRHGQGQQHAPSESQSTEQDEEPTLANDPTFSYVHLHIAEVERNNVFQALRWYRDVGHFKRRCVVEFPGVLLPSFKYTLEALQGMSRSLDVPFSELLAPSQEGQDAQLGPPLYAAGRGFKFDLSCLTEGNTGLKHSTYQPLNPEELAKNSTLDTTQSIALLDSLSRCLALVQGPPGTGKSYTGEKLIKVLLANKKAAKLGPILCVCYTNHALDQLLEHLLDAGVKQIVRIGSRSKSERLEKVNLRVVVEKSDRTKAEKHSVWVSECSLRDHTKSMNGLLDELRTCHTPRSLQKYLEDRYPWYHNEFFGKDEEGYQMVGGRPNQTIDGWRYGGNHDTSPPRQVDDLLRAKLWDMSHGERTRLYNHWLKDIRDPIVGGIVRECLEYTKSKRKRDMVVREVDLRCLSGADVIGVTTTGLARSMDMLQKLRCKVMLCEEAGEVLEAHTLTALLPSVEHAILIGDHLQLRPQTQNYELQSSNPRGAQYSHDMSLFERLVKPPHAHEPRLPYRTLETQRRMHPCIADLVRQTLYPSLVDGGSVSTYPDVSGLKRRLFWLHHEQLEDHANQQDPNTTSHTNSFEVDMTIALVQHLVRQGRYAPDDIAVITPYLGQLFLLRRRMTSLFEISVGDRDQEELEALDAERSEDLLDSQTQTRPISKKTSLLQSIRLATVDNFQGEEAKVVVISLVRSNEEKKCGFLRTSNRINVLLSRAQHGMYLIGNSKTYGHIDMWTQVLDLLKRDGNLGAQLELKCPSICGETCPDAKFCQTCCSADIKSAVVDYIMGMEYHEIDLDEDPCIFPQCGHFITRSNMDGIMDMKAHYDMSPEGNPTSLARASLPFSLDEVKTCPTCRGSLRSIGRYGRIVRRAMLDEATKKFISWSNNEYLKLANRLVDAQQALSELEPPRPLQKATRPAKKVFGTGRVKQLHTIRDWIGVDRYVSSISLWNGIRNFTGQVRKEEQPFQRVADFVEHAIRQRRAQSNFAFDESQIQVKGFLQASALSLRCDTVILSDFTRVHEVLMTARDEIRLDFTTHFKECESLIQLARTTKYPREEVEGHIYFAKFCAFQRRFGIAKEPAPAPVPAPVEAPAPAPAQAQAEAEPPTPSAADRLSAQGNEHLDAARQLLTQYPSTKQLFEAEIEATAVQLRDGVFYQGVSGEEMRAVYAAMAREFSGTGHWYTCENGHPFTVGECGMPMQQARCPECGGPVGGSNHQPAEGVRRAEDIEELARGVRELGI
ncbi:hypothetical protein SLS62_002403 [Diatrype stigma]|uniref:NFX1-type zinc finger-containing protein 1 n=1 Tax=Diatrype stigma TaxID=117547 RepID=A0AAN9V6L0_9PEZI